MHLFVGKLVEQEYNEEGEFEEEELDEDIDGEEVSFNIARYCTRILFIFVRASVIRCLSSLAKCR